MCIGLSEEFLWQIFFNFTATFGSRVYSSDGAVRPLRGLPAQDSTILKDADKHPCLERDSKPAFQCWSGQDPRDISLQLTSRIHVNRVPCHHGMARPQVVDGEDGFQIWRVAANISNKQSRTTGKGWSSNLRVLRGLTTPQCHTGPQPWTDSLERRKVKSGLEGVDWIHLAQDSDQ
jgi:hypothetical protein